MHTYVMAFGVGFTFEQCGASLACLWVAPSNAPPPTPAVPCRPATLAGMWIALC
jgi:hypothetical protein